MIHGNASKYTRAWDRLHQYYSILIGEILPLLFLCYKPLLYLQIYICQMALIINNSLSLWSSHELGTIQAVSHCPLISDAQVSSQACPCGICGGCSGTGKEILLCTPVFIQSVSFYLHSTFIRTLPVLYNLSKWQLC